MNVCSQESEQRVWSLMYTNCTMTSGEVLNNLVTLGVLFL